MSEPNTFDLKDFIPYLLNQAADTTSRDFEGAYKTKYGMLRTEWRVLFHLGRYGKLTAKEICDRARLHKTKVSRAVYALEQKRFLVRKEVPDDRRHETLSLTPKGQSAFQDLVKEAQRFDDELMSAFSIEEADQMRALLVRLAKL